jgi:hypothetical protein
MIFFTFFMFLFCGSPRCIRGICGGAPERGRPCNVSHCAVCIAEETYKRIFMLQIPQCREQPWFQHVDMGMVTAAEPNAEVTRIGGTKRRRRRNFLVGRRVNFLFHDNLRMSSITHIFRNEEVQNQRYDFSTFARYAPAHKFQILTPSPSSTLRRAPAKTSALMPTSQMWKMTMPGANTTLPSARASSGSQWR